MKKGIKRIAAFVIAAVMVLAIVALAACSAKSTQLAAPVISLSGNKVTWQAVEHADSYDVTVGTKAAVNVTTTEYTVTETAPGDYNVTVVAKSSNSNYTDSNPSNKVIYRVSETPPAPTQLAAPVISLSENKVTWQAVAHADSYDVTVGTKAAVNVKTTEYTVTETAPGDYDITVVAKSSDSNYTASNPSNKVTFTVNAPEPDAFIVTAKADYVVVDYNEGWTVDFSNYDFSDLIEAKKGNDAIEYSELTVTSAGTNCGEDALKVTVKYGDDTQEVSFDVYYGIADKNQLRAITDLTAWYIITEDIAFNESGDPYAPLGEFSGHFNGNYKKISNLDIYTEEGGASCGLFSRNTGTIENVCVVSGKVYGTTINAVIAGTNSGTIKNCFVNVTRVGGGGSYAAGITYGGKDGNVSLGTIEGCVVIAMINTDAPRTIAGIVGYGEAGTAKNNLFIRISEQGAQGALGVISEVEVSNNAAIDYDKLVFSEDGNQYWSSDDDATKYENNLTEQITALVKEYLLQLTTAA